MIKKEMLYNDDGEPYTGFYEEKLPGFFRINGEYKNGFPKGVHKTFKMFENKDGSILDKLCVENYFEDTGVNSYMKEHIAYNSKGQIYHKEYYEPILNDKGCCVDTRCLSHYDKLDNGDMVTTTFEFKDGVNFVNIETAKTTGVVQNYNIISHLKNGQKEYSNETLEYKLNDNNFGTVNYKKNEQDEMSDICIEFKYISSEGSMINVENYNYSVNVYAIKISDIHQQNQSIRYVSTLEMEKLFHKMHSYILGDKFDIAEYEKFMIELFSGKISLEK